jgi:hypothetical protein
MFSDLKEKREAQTKYVIEKINYAIENPAPQGVAVNYT